MNPIELCTHFQTILKPLGFYIALTGSNLYGKEGGGGSGKDLDVIIYPHLNDKGNYNSKLKEQDILKALSIDFEEPEIDIHYDGADFYIWIGKHEHAPRIDVFFMQGSTL